MGAAQEVLPDLASSEETIPVNDELADHVPDPSAGFLERKDRLREEAAAKPRSHIDDQRGSYRGNTASGAWLPLRHGHGK